MRQRSTLGRQGAAAFDDSTQRYLRMRKFRAQVCLPTGIPAWFAIGDVLRETILHWVKRRQRDHEIDNATMARHGHFGAERDSRSRRLGNRCAGGRGLGALQQAIHATDRFEGTAEIACEHIRH